MNRTGVYSGLALSLWLALVASSGCAGDDAKYAVDDAGAGGEGGDVAGGASGAVASGGSVSGSTHAGSGTGGSSEGGMSGDGGGAVAGNDAGSGAGNASSGGAGGAAAAGAGGSGTSDAGTGSTGESTPVPSACTSCGSDSCVAARVACQNDPACVSCRDENYQTLACAQNSNFISWITCICNSGCTVPCSALCAG